MSFKLQITTTPAKVLLGCPPVQVSVQDEPIPNVPGGWFHHRLRVTKSDVWSGCLQTPFNIINTSPQRMFEWTVVCMCFIPGPAWRLAYLEDHIPKSPDVSGSYYCNRRYSTSKRGGILKMTITLCQTCMALAQGSLTSPGSRGTSWGSITGDGQVVVKDSRDGSTPVDLPLEKAWHRGVLPWKEAFEATMMWRWHFFFLREKRRNTVVCPKLWLFFFGGEHAMSNSCTVGSAELKGWTSLFWHQFWD